MSQEIKMIKKKEFSVVVDGKNLDLCVMTPTSADRKEGQKIYNGAFTEALKSGAVVRAKLDDILVEQGLWDDNKQIEFDTIQKQLTDYEAKLEKGGIPLSAAKDIAIEMRKLRAQFREIIADKTSLDNHSAEGQADSERFNYLVYACTYHKDGKTRYFTSYRNYMDLGDDPVSVSAAHNLANLLYNLEDNYEKKLPENKFLHDYKFVDDNLRFINKEGKLVDFEGRLVNEFGRYIDEEGNYIDKYGNRIDEEGNLETEFTPFTDEEGNPVTLEDTTESTDDNEIEEQPAKKVRKSSAKKKTQEA